MHADLERVGFAKAALRRHAQRGQAVVETVIFLPMFLIVLFGTIWAVKQAVQYERVESAVRYAGLISQQVNPYADFSLYSMYGQLGSVVVPTVPCASPPTDPLSDAAPTYHSSQTSTASAPFWSPANGGVATCTISGLVGVPAGTGLIQDVIMRQQNPTMSSSVSVGGPLAAKLGANTLSKSANLFFFRAIGENTLLACYPTLNTQTNWSLNYKTDPALATAPVALTSVVTPIKMIALPSCVTWN